MAGGIPALSGNELAKLLEADDWRLVRQSRHGRAYCKQIGAEARVTTIQRTSKSLPPGTLAAILGPKQTGLGRKGLKKLLDKHR